MKRLKTFAIFCIIGLANITAQGAATMPTPFTKEQLSSNVFRISYDLKTNDKWEAWALLTSDRHWDNPKSDLNLQKEHLELAIKRNAPVIDAGDFFCCMQGKWDKRSNKSSIRPEHQTDNYFDTLVEDASNWFAPYAKNIVAVGVGNHEAEVKKRHEIDIIERFTALLSSKGKSNVRSGHFSGFVFFRFRAKTECGTSRSVILHYDHGYGGGGPVTDDMIQHQRRAVYLPDADIVVSGHTHGAWFQERARKRVSHRGVVYQDVQTHIKLGTYKDDYGQGLGGWAVERGHPPKPKGAWWVRFFWHNPSKRVLYEVMRAQ